MTLSEWVLETIESNWPGEFPDDLERVNRDDSEQMDTGIRSRTSDLERANFVGAATTSEVAAPLGAGGTDVVQPVVQVRVEGLHADEYGHVDNAAAFRSLVDDVKQTLRQEHSPTVGDAHPASIVKLYVENETDQSHLFRDHFLAEFDVRFVGDRNP